MPAIPDGTACHVVCTSRRQRDVSDDDFERGDLAVTRDLETLKRALANR